MQDKQDKKSIQNFGSSLTSATNAPPDLGSPLVEESTLIIVESAERVKQNKALRQREIITNLYPTDLLESCK